MGSRVISQTPEGEAPITIETVPPQKCRLRHGTSHRLDGIPHEFANMPEFIHHTVTIRHAAASRQTLEFSRAENAPIEGACFDKLTPALLMIADLHILSKNVF